MYILLAVSKGNEVISCKCNAIDYQRCARISQSVHRKLTRIDTRTSHDNLATRRMQ